MTKPFNKNELLELQQRINYCSSTIRRIEAETVLQEQLGCTPLEESYRTKLIEIEDKPLEVIKYFKECTKDKYKNYILRDVVELEFPQYLHQLDKLLEKK